MFTALMSLALVGLVAGGGFYFSSKMDEMISQPDTASARSSQNLPM